MCYTMDMPNTPYTYYRVGSRCSRCNRCNTIPWGQTDTMANTVETQVLLQQRIDLSVRLSDLESEYAAAVEGIQRIEALLGGRPSQAREQIVF